VAGGGLPSSPAWRTRFRRAGSRAARRTTPASSASVGVEHSAVRPRPSPSPHRRSSRPTCASTRPPPGPWRARGGRTLCPHDISSSSPAGRPPRPNRKHPSTTSQSSAHAAAAETMLRRALPHPGCRAHRRPRLGLHSNGPSGARPAPAFRHRGGRLRFPAAQRRLQREKTVGELERLVGAFAPPPTRPVACTLLRLQRSSARSSDNALSPASCVRAGRPPPWLGLRPSACSC